MSPRKKQFDSLIMIRMPAELRGALERMAEANRRPLSDYCRIILEDHARGPRKPEKKK